MNAANLSRSESRGTSAFRLYAGRVLVWIWLLMEGGDHDLFWGFNVLDRPQKLDGINRRPFGAGIFCNVTAMAKIGYLYLRRGRWQGRQIIPEEFVSTATTIADGLPAMPVADGLDWTAGASCHYGLLWWNNNDGAIAGVPRDAFRRAA